ncbi:hypothetical protein vnz_37245 (plasmid) [Streptomyces venezuelae]|nr:hypothetical protein vnz_37245 [Streptomyces venezuelae]
MSGLVSAFLQLEQLVELRVAAASHELRVRAALDDAATLEKTMRSARRALARQWVMKRVALPAARRLRRVKMWCSVRAASAMVGSSLTRTGASRWKARVMAMRCHWQPERPCPPHQDRAREVSRPSGSRASTASAPDASLRRGWRGRLRVASVRAGLAEPQPQTGRVPRPSAAR